VVFELRVRWDDVPQRKLSFPVLEDGAWRLSETFEDLGE
jgi:hypothetical protein